MNVSRLNCESGRGGSGGGGGGAPGTGRTSGSPGEASPRGCEASGVATPGVAGIDRSAAASGVGLFSATKPDARLHSFIGVTLFGLIGGDVGNGGGVGGAMTPRGGDATMGKLSTCLENLIFEFLSFPFPWLFIPAVSREERANGKGIREGESHKLLQNVV